MRNDKRVREIKSLGLSINDYKKLINEVRKEGLHRIADLYAEQLQTLLANQKPLGNTPFRQAAID